MSNIYHLQTDNQIFEEASLWVTRLDRGLSDEETIALQQWLAQDARHKASLLEMAQLWDRMDSLAVLSELFDPPAAQPRAARSFARPAWAMAASVAALVLALQWLLPSGLWQAPASLAQAPSAPASIPAEAIANTLYETGIGAHSTINLPDGTRLLLNTNTQVSVSFSDSERLLVLNKGELLVEVAHDKKRPLRVQVGDRIVEAVGTVFNVYRKDQQAFDVIVTEGKVHVKAASDKTNTIATGTASAAVIQELVQGEKLSLNEQSEQEVAVETLGSTAIHDRLSWRDGTLIFRGETLADALHEVSRYTPTSFKIVDKRINEMRIAGLYKAGDVDGLLASLKENFNINSMRASNGVIELSLR